MYDVVFKAVRHLRRDPFRGIAHDPARLETPLRRGAAPVQYVIFFTPRSGSSRLTEILAGTGSLGRPSEYFSGAMMPACAAACGAASLALYLRLLPRVRRAGDAFGFEIAYDQLLTAFGSEAAFRTAFPGLRHFWLIREDIVAQAVSASRTAQTGLFHLAAPSPADVAAADARFRYRPLDLRERILRLRWMERRTERYFARHGIAPVRLSYERLLRLSAAETAGLFAGALGLRLADGAAPETAHAKVSSEQSRAFAGRFRAENARWIARIDAARAPMLDALRRAEYRAGSDATNA